MRSIALVLVLLCSPFVPAPKAAPAAPDGAAIGARIDRYLSAMEAFGFSGAILVAHEGEVVLRTGYGLADRASRRPYTPDTVQSHGSITKQMTGAAVLLLEQRGRLSVDDTIDRFFDGVPADKRGITLHQLLTHTSGMVGGIGADEEPIDAETYVERALAEPLAREPGTEYAYSNLGYSLLGIVVERVSGRGYERFLRDELLLPVGMNDTGYVLPGWEDDRLAEGYRNGALWGRVHGRGWLDDGPGWHLRANGGMHTTVDDMYRWLRTLRGEGALDAETARRWTTGVVDEGYGDTKYAYGWVDQDTEWGRMISHDGSNRIFSAALAWLPEIDLFVYLHGNTTQVPVIDQRERLLRAAFDPEFPMPPLVDADADARPAVADARVGTYRLGADSLELTADDTRLIARVWDQPAIDLLFDLDETRRARATAFNDRVREAMEGLEAGREDAIAPLIGPEDDAVESTRPFLERIEQIGDLVELHVIGSFENVPGSRFAPYGPWTTFVYAEFANWNQYWNLVWNEDGNYRGNGSGPWPSFTLVPVGEGRYRAVAQEAPWHAIDLRFEDGCLVGGELRACAEG